MISFHIQIQLLEDMDQNDFIIFQMMAMATSSSNDLFTSHEMEQRAGQSVDPTLEFKMSWVLCKPHQHYSKLC